MTKPEFAGVLAYLEAAVGATIAPDRAEVYFDLLGDLPLPALQLAARQSLLESKYPTVPTPGALRQLALELMRPKALTAMEAWELVRRAINRYGYAQESRALATLPEPARSTAAALGWVDLCNSENPETTRAQFRDAYDRLATRDTREALLPVAYQVRAAGLVAQMAETFQLEHKGVG